ncbi:MAG: hypothetical protein U1F07_10645 [Rubrivivax sp.]
MVCKPWAYAAARRQREELHHQALLACAGTLRLQLPHVIGVFDVAMPVEAARVARDELLGVVDTHSVGPGLEHQGAAREVRRHRVVVGIERHAAGGGGAHVADGGQLVAVGVQRPEAARFLGEALDGPLVRGRVQPHVGHRVHPGLRDGLQRGEVGQLESGQQVFLDPSSTLRAPASFVSH